MLKALVDFLDQVRGVANEKLQEVTAMDDGQGKELGTQGMIRAYLSRI